MEEAEATTQINPETERTAAQRAKVRSNAARWDLDIAVFLFAILIIIIILLFQQIGIEIVAPVAIFGLAMVWLVGWRRGGQLYERFYEEELEKGRIKIIKGTLEETVLEQVQKALRERGRIAGKENGER